MIRSRTVASLLTCSLFASAPVSAQNLWSKVPALPTTCFNQDQFFDQAERVYQEVSALARKQTEANAAVGRQLTELDGSTQQARMMAFLQKDPVNAGKFMQDAATAGQRAQELLTDVERKRKALKEQFETLQSQYKADMAKVGPLWTTFQNATDPGSGVGAAKINEYAAAFNSAYDQVCAKWWKATNPFLSYLADVRKFEVETFIPYEEFTAKGKRQQFDIMGISSAGYRSPGEAEAVAEYLKEAQKIFQLRFADRAHFP